MTFPLPKWPASGVRRIFVAALLILCGVSPALSQGFDDSQLPLLGDSSSSIFSLQQEHELGRAWLMAFRSQVQLVHDPLLQDYVENLVYRLATHSELKDRRLQTVIIKNRTVNAFAVPGGIIGVHNGLFLVADTEAEFAAVLAHELGHLSQRHFARTVEAEKRSALPAMAGLLAGIILAATSGSDAGIATIQATQAAALQSRLHYSRLHEEEADRAGMETLVKAGIDPNAEAAMFERLQDVTRYGSHPPEFLMTHPVTARRISDAKNRARQYPRKMYTDNPIYQLMRARVEVSFYDDKKEAVDAFRAKQKQGSRHPDADQYGLVLALTANRQYREAQKELRPLIKANPDRLAYIVAQGELYNASGQYRKSIKLLNNALSLSPGNHPLTMLLANALLKANEPQKAEALLEAHSRQRPNDPDVWYLLAETHGLAGNIVGVHEARAEYYVLNGVLDKALQQLGYALPMLKQNHVATAKVEERIRQIKRLQEEIKKL